jgi:hypothetical protein
MPVMLKLWSVLLPELGHLPPSDQVEALQTARKTDLDVFELLGVAFGLVAVTAFTQYVLAEASLPSRLAAALLNFGVAVPLVALVVAPFHIRRLRRGLQMRIETRGQHK